MSVSRRETTFARRTTIQQECEEDSESESAVHNHHYCCKAKKYCCEFLNCHIWRSQWKTHCFISIASMSLSLISPLVLLLFGVTKTTYAKAEEDSYKELYWKYMLNNFVLYSTFCISMISFLKVPRLVTFRDAALRNTPIAIAIAITQLVIAIFLMLSVKVDYFDIPLAAQLGLLVPFASMNALLLS